MLRNTVLFRVKFVLVFAALILLVFSGCTRFCVFGANVTDAVVAIGAAKEEVVLCYDAVAQADDAGANVSALLVRLDEAGELLSLAEWSYDCGDFDSAVDFAGQSQGKLNGFVVEAEALAETLAWAHHGDFLVNVVGSIVGAAAVVCGSFVVWHFFKKKYGGGVVA